MQVLIGILIASFVEWFIHRFLLHGLGKNKNSIWHFHWKHHKSVRVENGYDLLYFKYNQGYPKERLSLFLAFLLISPLFFYYPIVAATLTAYLFVYYFVHKKAHRDVRWARKWIPWHYDHHMGRNQDKNWGIVLPIYDYLLGTRKKYF
jgi:sterol desaturase/sphingolipid hydroxylase (fatty acid hydroxylase superfamily)|tara:strand:+ start:971 stop:1414 length:444 start_codon:yes stop_codon:yes gene_type:complete